jgi:uncharacterized surface protein with fasciclin (FAS1) repeats
MKSGIRRSGAVIAVAALAFLGTACSNDEPAPDTGGADTATEQREPAAEQPDPAMADLVGPGCADYAKANPDGAASVDGMAAAPVAEAASNNPLLTTLVAAVSGQLNPNVNLVDTLNGSEFTVFAPVDDAFAKIDPATVESLKTDTATLQSILTYHVVPGQLAPDAVVGEHPTAQGGMVTVTGSGDSLKVNDANVICGGVHTQNATVYLIDSVLLPK